jgi:PAS domain S-box-containing protein
VQSNPPSYDSTLALIDMRPMARWAILAMILASTIRFSTGVALNWTFASYLSAIGLACGCVGYILASKGYPRIGLLLVQSVTVALCSLSAYQQDGLSNIALPIIPLIVVFSGLLFSSLLLLAVTAYSISLVLLMFLGRVSIRGIAYNPNDIGDLVIFVSTVLLAAAVGHVISREVVKAFSEIAQGKEKLRQTAEALKAAEERWHLALVGTNDGIWDWEIEKDRVYISDRWKGMLGYAPDEIPNTTKSWVSLVHPEDLPEVNACLKAHLDGLTPFYTIEYRMRCKNGSYLWILARGRALFDASNKPLRFTGSHTDITEQKHAAEVVQQAREQAEAANQAKSEFLANMSHELRTPLNAVSAMSELLARSPIEESQRELVGTIQSSSKLLLRIINNVLDFSKIEKGQVQLERIPTDLSQLIRAIIAMQSAEAERKGLKLRYSIDPRLPAFILADPTCLQQILLNFMANSLKFTEFGSVSLDVDCIPAESRTRIRFTVTDSGIGIPESMLDRIFDDFYQGDASMTRRYGGTGLGLAIARKLAALKGGEVGVESKLGEGSQFWFEMPLLVPETLPTKEPMRELSANPTHAPRVLLAEDNKVNQRVAFAILSRFGCVVEVVNDGVEAVQAFEQTEFDLILMDCHMPVLDGLSATRQIRAQSGRGATIPIIALTADVLGGIQQQCLEAGMTGYMSKPIEMQRIEELLAPWLNPSPQMEKTGLHSNGGSSSIENI